MATRVFSLETPAVGRCNMETSEKEKFSLVNSHHVGFSWFFFLALIASYISTTFIRQKLVPANLLLQCLNGNMCFQLNSIYWTLSMRQIYETFAYYGMHCWISLTNLRFQISPFNRSYFHFMWSSFNEIIIFVFS